MGMKWSWISSKRSRTDSLFAKISSLARIAHLSRRKIGEQYGFRNLLRWRWSSRLASTPGFGQNSLRNEISGLASVHLASKAATGNQLYHWGTVLNSPSHSRWKIASLGPHQKLFCSRRMLEWCRHRFNSSTS